MSHLIQREDNNNTRKKVAFLQTFRIVFKKTCNFGLSPTHRRRKYCGECITTQQRQQPYDSTGKRRFDQRGTQGLCARGVEMPQRLRSLRKVPHSKRAQCRNTVCRLHQRHTFIHGNNTGDKKQKHGCGSKVKQPHSY